MSGDDLTAPGGICAPVDAMHPPWGITSADGPEATRMQHAIEKAMTENGMQAQIPNTNLPGWTVYEPAAAAKLLAPHVARHYLHPSVRDLMPTLSAPTGTVTFVPPEAWRPTRRMRARQAVKRWWSDRAIVVRARRVWDRARRVRDRVRSTADVWAGRKVALSDDEVEDYRYG